MPQLRKALPVLNLPTRAHAATAAMLARSLHTEKDVLPINLVNLANRHALDSSCYTACKYLCVGDKPSQNHTIWYLIIVKFARRRVYVTYLVQVVIA